MTPPAATKPISKAGHRAGSGTGGRGVAPRGPAPSPKATSPTEINRTVGDTSFGNILSPETALSEGYPDGARGLLRLALASQRCSGAPQALTAASNAWGEASVALGRINPALNRETVTATGSKDPLGAAWYGGKLIEAVQSSSAKIRARNRDTEARMRGTAGSLSQAAQLLTAASHAVDVETYRFFQASRRLLDETRKSGLTQQPPQSLDSINAQINLKLEPEFLRVEQTCRRIESETSDALLRLSAAVDQQAVYLGTATESFTLDVAGASVPTTLFPDITLQPTWGDAGKLIVPDSTDRFGLGMANGAFATGIMMLKEGRGAGWGVFAGATRNLATYSDKEITNSTTQPIWNGISKGATAAGATWGSDLFFGKLSEPINARRLLAGKTPLDLTSGLTGPVAVGNFGSAFLMSQKTAVGLNAGAYSYGSGGELKKNGPYGEVFDFGYTMGAAAGPPTVVLGLDDLKKGRGWSKVKSTACGVWAVDLAAVGTSRLFDPSYRSPGPVVTHGAMSVGGLATALTICREKPPPPPPPFSPPVPTGPLLLSPPPGPMVGGQRRDDPTPDSATFYEARQARDRAINPEFNLAYANSPGYLAQKSKQEWDTNLSYGGALLTATTITAAAVVFGGPVVLGAGGALMEAAELGTAAELTTGAAQLAF
jgi:hypothetical protein